jgi:CRISPR-associated protein Cas1
MGKSILHFSNPAILKLKYDQLVIEMEDRGPITRPLEDIGCIVVENHQVTCTTPVLVRAAEMGVVIVWCDSKHMPVAYSSPFVGNTMQNLRHRQQWAAGKPVFKQVWAQLIQAKLRNQATVLEILGKDHLRLLRLASEVKSGDKDNLEAVGARYYWSRLFKEVPGFVREPAGPFPNNYLNYGYAIVRAACARALVGAGLCLTLGVFHHNQYNPFALVDDCMEPFRPWVDLAVFQLMAEGAEEDLDKSGKARLLQVVQEYGRVDDKNVELTTGMEMLASSLAKCFEGIGKELKIPSMNV